MMRRFYLERADDETGISGTGRVAEGVLFASGKVAIEWLTEPHNSVGLYVQGVEAVEAIHGHNGKTQIVWVDE